MLSRSTVGVYYIKAIKLIIKYDIVFNGWLLLVVMVGALALFGFLD